MYLIGHSTHIRNVFCGQYEIGITIVYVIQL